MSLLEGLILGVIQGLTEFLPVSSSGHLVIGQAVLGISVPGVVFEVALHVATLVSVLIVYRGRIGRLAGGAVRGDGFSWRYLGLLVLATVPAAVVGLLFGTQVEALFERPSTVGFALLVTGGLLWSTRAARRYRGLGQETGEEPREVAPTVAVALLMGFAQAFALVPGISRSGATVVAGLWAGVDVREAAAFSFLMAVPAIAGAAVLKLPDLVGAGSVPGGSGLVAGAIVAAVTGIGAIRIFVSMLRSGSFHRFGVYCWVVGAGFLLFLGLR